MSPAPSPILADSLAPLIFYLVIVVFWTIAKKISDKAQKQRESVDERHDVDPDLKDFLETLTGQKPRKAARPQPPPPPAPEPEPPTRTPQRRRPIEPQPDEETERPFRRRRPAPRQRFPVDAPARLAVPVQTPHLEPAHYRDVHIPAPVASTERITAGEITDQDLPTRLRTPMNLAGANMFPRITSMAMPMPSLKLPIRSAVQEPHNRIRIQGRDTIKRIMIERIILGPPLGTGAGYSDRTYAP